MLPIRPEMQVLNLNLEEHTIQHGTSRRAFERVNLSLPVTLIASRFGTSMISHGRTSDLSENGIGIATDEPLQTGQPVQVEFNVPLRSKVVKLHAKVKYQSDNFYGLQFEHATEQQLKQIRKITSGF